MDYEALFEKVRTVATAPLDLADGLELVPGVTAGFDGGTHKWVWPARSGGDRGQLQLCLRELPSQDAAQLEIAATAWNDDARIGRTTWAIDLDESSLERLELLRSALILGTQSLRSLFLGLDRAAREHRAVEEIIARLERDRRVSGDLETEPLTPENPSASIRAMRTAWVGGEDSAVRAGASFSADDFALAADGLHPYTLPQEIPADQARRLGAEAASLQAVLLDDRIALALVVGGWASAPPARILARVTGGDDTVEIPLERMPDDPTTFRGEGPWSSGQVDLTVDLFVE